MIGESTSFDAQWVPVELLTGPAGRIEIGSDTWINYGTVFAAAQSVKVGARTMIGQLCILSDVAIPEAVEHIDPALARPIEIGNDVWLATRVTVRPGVRIGDGAVIMAGSIVESDVPPNVMAGGIPARLLPKHVALRTDAPSATRTPPDSTAVATLPEPSAAVAFEIAGHLIADFTIDEMALDLASSETGKPVGARVAPYGQVAQTLLTTAPADASDFAVVWTRPENMVPSFGRLLAFEDVDREELVEDVDAFCALVTRAAPGYRSVFVATWTVAPWQRGRGFVDGRAGGAAHALAAMNLRLMDALAATPNVYVLDAERWCKAIGPSAWSATGWYLGKMAFARPVLAEAALDIRAALAMLDGGSRKLLVIDLDDTLWGGVVGDVGPEGLRLGGHDGVGEAFADFQSALRDLKHRGIVLAIVSKNEESIALEAIRTHPGMVLKESDFVAWRINWSDKAANVADLASALNLGLQSVVFIDDNPVERARVRDALPEVLVPEWPASPFLYRRTLEALRCFDAPARSREDRERTQMYAQETQRQALRAQVGSLDDWLKGLDIRVAVTPLDATNVARAAQLLNKTNQLNLSTRRLTESELTAWASAHGRSFWTVSVSDRLGQAGLTGLVSLEVHGDEAVIVDYVLSCRVMGRKVEETMIHLAVDEARARQARHVVAHYLPTPKNKPCLAVWLASGFRDDNDGRFTWDTSNPYPLSDVVTLEREG